MYQISWITNFYTKYYQKAKIYPLLRSRNKVSFSYLLIQLILGLFLLLIYLVAVFRNAFHIAILLPSVFLGQLCSSLLVYTYILLSFSPNLSFLFVSLLIAIILSGIVFRKFYALAPLKVQLNLRRLYKTLNVTLLSLLGMFFIYSVYLECTQALQGGHWRVFQRDHLDWNCYRFSYGCDWL
jgi:hypothetical protein